MWISKSGQIPEAGSPEAEAILGRTTKTEKGEGLAKRNATHHNEQA